MRRGRWRVARVSLPNREDVGGPERQVVVAIDGAPRTFTLIEAGEAQVAELNSPDHRVMLQANRWPIEDIELVTVTDLTPIWRAGAGLRRNFGPTSAWMSHPHEPVAQELAPGQPDRPHQF